MSTFHKTYLRSLQGIPEAHHNADPQEGGVRDALDIHKAEVDNGDGNDVVDTCIVADTWDKVVVHVPGEVADTYDGVVVHLHSLVAGVDTCHPVQVAGVDNNIHREDDLQEGVVVDNKGIRVVAHGVVLHVLVQGMDVVAVVADHG